MQVPLSQGLKPDKWFVNELAQATVKVQVPLSQGCANLIFLQYGNHLKSMPILEQVSEN